MITNMRFFGSILIIHGIAFAAEPVAPCRSIEQFVDTLLVPVHVHHRNITNINRTECESLPKKLPLDPRIFSLSTRIVRAHALCAERSSIDLACVLHRNGCSSRDPYKVASSTPRTRYSMHLPLRPMHGIDLVFQRTSSR